VNAGGGLHYDRYAGPKGDEAMMRIGAAGAPAILFVPPLFEELNRTRALIAAVMRSLAARGFACHLPDLPGTNESVLPLESCRWEDWRAAVRAAAAALGRPAVVALRGGCLLDGAAEAPCFYRFAPAEGVSLARDLARSGLVSGGGSAGYPLDDALAAALREAKLEPLAPLRVARLASDLAEADAKLEGPALWRRSEPGISSELAEVIASDISEWVARCGG
jgi:pimeloyl-ACP methyl ester carboxylesterase